MKVVDIGSCRDLLAALFALVQRVKQGDIQGLVICSRRWDGHESVSFAGDYRDDREGALRASMQMSWELTKTAEGGVTNEASVHARSGKPAA